MNGAVLLLSGGLDSQVLLASEKASGHWDKMSCVGFNYGQKHVKELDHAQKIATYYGVSFTVLQLPALRGSALTEAGTQVPAGLHYADPAQAITVVPGRNAIMLSVAAALASSSGMGTVLFGAHAGDATVYADCREEFVTAFDAALFVGYGVRLSAPFLHLTKREIVGRGRTKCVPSEMSWTCYVGNEAPCGACGSCVERAEACR